MSEDPFGEFARAGQGMFLGRHQRRALKALARAIDNQYLAALVGPVGSGKTQLWRHLREELDGDGRHVFCFLRDPSQERITTTQIAEAILGVTWRRRVPRTRQARLRVLEEGLMKERDQGRIVTLVIEEGQLLGDPILRMFKGLSELYDGFNKLLGVLVLAQTQLHDVLKSYRVEEVRRRLRVIDLPGIHHAEIGDYLAHRLGWSGCRRKVFDDGAVAVLRRRQYRPVTTTPLGLGNVAAKAMEVAHGRGHRAVDADDAEEALRRGDSA